MKKPERKYLHYLDDILLSMERIEEYIFGFDFQKFKWDYKTVDAVMRNFEIIGEAAKETSKRNQSNAHEYAMGRNVSAAQPRVSRILWN